MIRDANDTEQNFNFSTILVVKVTKRENPKTIPYFMATETHYINMIDIQKQIVYAPNFNLMPLKPGERFEATIGLLFVCLAGTVCNCPCHPTSEPLTFKHHRTVRLYSDLTSMVPRTDSI